MKWTRHGPRERRQQRESRIPQLRGIGGTGEVSEDNNKVKVAIVGSGLIGTDLMYKLLEEPGHMELAMVAGIEPESEGLDEDNVNLMTCGAQATVPMAYAVSQVTPVRYAEMVSTIASLSAGPGTRQNIDEFTFTTSRGLEEIGGAEAGKAIIILNPADPPLIMRNTVYVIPEEDEINEEEITSSVEEVVADVQKAVPGYQLKNGPTFDERDTPWGKKPVIMMFLEVEGVGHFLPKYSGNLDIMTAAARQVGEGFARHLLGIEEVVA